MKRKISHLEPQLLWTHFEDICQVPRPSKKEEKIIAFLKDFAQRNKFSYQQDEAGNVLISKPATLGYEDRKTVILQSHLDMVCEKNSDVEHDFNVDPINAYVEGEWVKAEGTTLGADCGIGMAAAMSVLTDKDAAHGAVECLFTVDEETGLTGAFALKPGFMTGKILLNLDSEDEGELFIGCAGGIDTVATFNYQKEEVPDEYFPLKIEIKGLTGGHSGDDINKGRGNANKIMVRFLWQAYRKYGLKLSLFDGGNLRNAIAREARAILIVKKGLKENMVADFNVFSYEIKKEYELTEPKLSLNMGSTDVPEFVIDDATTKNILNAIYACPHGVYAMSSKMPGMVETSTNLASVKFIDQDKIEITTSQRSDIQSGRDDLASMVVAVLEMAGAQVRHSDGYPGWAPNPDSPILNVTRDAYEKLFGIKPVVRSIHAGLECGLFLEKYPDLDMVSFGPTIIGAHSPDERIHIEAVQKFWKHLKEVMRNIPVV